MRCERCGAENLETSKYCRECRAPLGPDVPEPRPLETPAPEEPTRFARFLSTAWGRKGPILMSLFVVLLMVVVFAPWVFMKLDILGIQIVSNSYSGWAIYAPRILFFISVIPLVVSLFLIAGIGTKRRVVETHICVFFAGVMFTFWLLVFALSQVIKSVVRNVQVLSLHVQGGQVVTIFLIAGFILGVIITTYDRGRELEAEGEEG